MSQKIIKLPDVMKMTALSRSSIYAFVGKNSFPKPVPLGERAVGWILSEVESWLNQKAESRGVVK